jgi:hypothetical protein
MLRYTLKLFFKIICNNIDLNLSEIFSIFIDMEADYNLRPNEQTTEFFKIFFDNWLTNNDFFSFLESF